MSAGGAGRSPAASSLARMNRSIGERGHRESTTVGETAVNRHPERPEPSRRFVPSRDRAAIGRGGSREAGRGRPRGSHLDPRGQRLDLGRRELLLRRHRDVALVADREDQQAPLRLAANDRRAGDAALQESLERVDAQLRLARRPSRGRGIDSSARPGSAGHFLEEREGRPGNGRILGVRGRRGRIPGGRTAWKEESQDETGGEESTNHASH